MLWRRGLLLASLNFGSYGAGHCDQRNHPACPPFYYACYDRCPQYCCYVYVKMRWRQAHAQPPYGHVEFGGIGHQLYFLRSIPAENSVARQTLRTRTKPISYITSELTVRTLPSPPSRSPLPPVLRLKLATLAVTHRRQFRWRRLQMQKDARVQ